MSPSPQAEGTVLLLGSSCTEPPRAPRCYHKSSQVLNLVKKMRRETRRTRDIYFWAFLAWNTEEYSDLSCFKRVCNCFIFLLLVVFHLLQHHILLNKVQALQLLFPVHMLLKTIGKKGNNSLSLPIPSLPPLSFLLMNKQEPICIGWNWPFFWPPALGCRKVMGAGSSPVVPVGCEVRSGSGRGKQRATSPCVPWFCFPAAPGDSRYYNLPTCFS